MKAISINCAGIESEAQLLALLANDLEFTGFSGENADGLYESLTGINEETYITLFGINDLPFAEGIRATLQDAETDNIWLNISLA